MTMEAERIDQSTRALFSIYFAEDTNAATASIYQFRARLAHICDGFPVPADLAALAASAINAFAFMTEAVAASRIADHRRRGNSVLSFATFKVALAPACAAELCVAGAEPSSVNGCGPT